MTSKQFSYYNDIVIKRRTGEVGICRVSKVGNIRKGIPAIFFVAISPAKAGFPNACLVIKLRTNGEKVIKIKTNEYGSEKS